MYRTLNELLTNLKPTNSIKIYHEISANPYDFTFLTFQDDEVVFYKHYQFLPQEEAKYEALIVALHTILNKKYTVTFYEFNEDLDPVILTNQNFQQFIKVPRRYFQHTKQLTPLNHQAVEMEMLDEKLTFK